MHRILFTEEVKKKNKVRRQTETANRGFVFE